MLLNFLNRHLLALTVCSTRHIVVLNASLVRLRLSKTAIITFLQFCTSFSQIPPKCGALGWMVFQKVIFCDTLLLILALSYSFKKAFSELAAPTKFVPMSLIMVFEDSRLATNFITAANHDPVSNDCATSICTALVVRQVKRQHHLFKVSRRNVFSKGPN